MILHIDTDTSGSLADKFLIASPHMQDGCFGQTVIYLVAHNLNGAFGLVVNMPLSGLDVRALMDELKIPYIDGLPSRPIYFGGPMETNKGHVLHTNDVRYPFMHEAHSGICFSGGVEVLKDVAKGGGPAKFMMVMGCAGWIGSQLEQELETGSWIVAPATTKLLFDTPDIEKSALSAASLGVDLSRLSATVGHA